MREEILFLHYPACTTCQKAKRWLAEASIGCRERHIVDDNPSKEELVSWYRSSGLELKKFFNTSGVLYKEMGLRDKLPTMSEDEQLQLLASHGKLVKRPLLVGDGFVLVGFKPEEWASKMSIK